MYQSIFKANVNDMLDRMEDPEKMVKQMIIEMEEALVKSTSALAKASGKRKEPAEAEGPAEGWRSSGRKRRPWP